MKQATSIKVDGISYNGPVLSKLSYLDFKKEVGHHFQGEGRDGRMRKLYLLIKKTFSTEKGGAE